MTKAQNVRDSLRLERIGLYVAFFAMAATGWQAYIARQQMRESLRAYVTVNTVNWVQATTAQERAPHIISEVGAKFENSGGTPAFRIDANVSYTFQPGPLSKYFQYIETLGGEEPNPRGHGVMPPHVPSDYVVGLEPVESLNAVMHGETKLYVFGHVSYDDIFGDRHTTTFCFEHHYPENVFTLCSYHNDTYEGDYKP